MISRSQRDSVGGGSSRIYEPTRFSGGGGSGRNFPLSSVAKSNFYPAFSDIRG